MNYAGKFDAKHDADGSGLHSHGHAHVETVSAHATHVPADAIIVPDAQLLFNADFKRSGVDLVLSRDDHELVLHDYFKGEKRAALSSPDGAHLTGELVNALTGHTEYAQAGGAAGANAVIGHVTKLAGSATAIRNGVSIILNQGDNVEKGDVVQSGSDSTVGITFIDGTVFGLSSNARMVLNEMVYDPNGSNNSSLISLVAGTISFVAGQTAKHGDMKIDTPVATMGIRGTAVLCEIDFNVSTPGVPDAKFQVLVEPDGTTGSYILFDKNTLTPIAEVNKAGQLIHIREGLVSISNAGLSDEMQKLINEVFAEKYAYDTTPKTFDHQFTDSIVPLPLTPIILTNGQTITGTAYILNTSDKTGPSGSSGPINSLSHIDGPPHAVIVNLLGQPISGFQITELAGKTGDSADLDSVSGAVNFVDINAGDAPSVSAKFGSFSYQNAAHQDVTAALNAQQLADIAAVEAKLVLTPNAGNNNVGTTAFSYSVPDSALDFLAAGETLTLTYNIKVDNNYGPNDESTPLTLTITITGTNDVPVITTSAPSIAFSGGTSVPGGDLPTSDPTSGTLAFTDVDLTDTHTVATALTGAVGVLNGITVLNGVDALPPGPLDLLKTALTASIAAGNDSTLTGNGTINWNLAELPVYIADFLPKGETLTLTYTVTLTDSQGATTTQDVIVTITGTDTPAVVWIATATPGSQPGGLWSDGSNWETGTVPTANDDAIIITNQLIGLTPSYPVTIDAPAFAKTVTLNDFSDLGNAHPELNNDSTLTIGGAFTLGVDSIVDNSGTIGVGGAMEVLDASILNNSGTIDLAQGGDFKDQTSITNAGKIDITGGTLNILVDVANAGGNLVIEGTARGTLSGAAITGGAINNSGEFDLSGGLLTSGSLDNAGTIDVSSIGNELLGETVTANYALEVLAGGSLSIDQGSTVANGGGTVTVDGTGTLTLNGASVTGGTVTNKSGGAIDLTGSGVLNTGSLDNAGKIDVSGSGNALNDETVTANNALEILAGGALSIDQGSTVANGGGTVTVDGTGTLTLNGASIAGGTVTNKSGGAIDLAGSGVLNTGSLDNAGKIDVSGSGNALNSETVTANNALEILAGGALSIDQGSTVANGGGTVTVDGTGTLTLNGASIAGGTVTNKSGGAIDLTGSGVLNTGSLDNAGKIDVSGSGNALNGETVTANNALEILAGGALSIDPTTIDNSGGTVTVDGTGTLTLNGATITGGTVNDSGEIDLTGSAAVKTGTLNSSGTIKVSGSGNALDGENVTNGGGIEVVGALTLDQSTTVANGGGTITIDSTGTLTLNNASISNGTLGNSGLVDATGTSGLHAIAITNALGATLESTGGVLTIDGSNTTFNNVGLLEANGGGLDLNTDTLTNTGTLKATDSSILELTSTTVTNTNGTVTVDALSTLDLNGGDSISNGTLGNSGLLDATGTNGLHDIAITNASGATLESTGGVLTIDGSNTTFNNVGLLEANGGGLDLNNDTLTNTGTLKATDSSILELTSTTVTNTNGTVTVDALSTLDLNGGDSISNGTLGNSGLVDATGTNGLHGIAITNALGATLESTGGVLTIDGSNTTFNNVGLLEANGGGLDLNNDTLTNTGTLKATDSSILELTSTTVTNTNGTVTVDALSTLDLNGGDSISNGTLGNSGLLDATGTNGLHGIAITNASGATLESTGGVLTIDGSNTTFNNAGLLEANGGGLDLNTDTLTNTGTLKATNSSTLELTNTGVTNTGGTVTVDAGSTLNLNGGDSITNGTLSNSGTLNSIGTNSIGAAVGGGGTLNVVGGTLTLTGDNTYTGATTINGGTLKLSGSGSIAASSGVADDATFDISATTAGASIVTLSGTGNVTLGANTLTLSNASTTFGGAIDGSGGLTLTAGTETLTGDNLYSGATTINGGTLKLSGTGSISASGDVVDDATFDISATTAGASIVTLSGTGNVTLGANTLTLSNASTTFGGAIDGSGGLTLTAGTETLTGDNLYSGATTINGGTLKLSGTGSISASSDVVDDATFDISATTAGASIVTLSGTGNVTLGANTLTLSNASTTFGGAIDGSGGLTLTAGTETLTGDNLYSGATTINGGTLKLSGTGSISASSDVVDDATFDISATTAGASIVTLSGTGNVTLGANTLTLSNASTTFGGAIDGSGGLTLTAGTETLTGDNLYSGATTINGGTLKLSGTGSISASSDVVDDATFDISATTAGASIVTLSGTGNVTLGANTLTLTAGAGSFSGVIGLAGDTGGLTVDGTGIETLSGDNLYTGLTTIGSNETLALSGSGSIAASSGVADHGTFDISGLTGNTSIATLSGAGNVTLGANTLTLSNASTTFGGAIDGSGGLTLTAGTETLTGANITYRGPTTINGGTLVVDGDIAASSATISGGGTLDLGGADAQAVTFNGAGTLQLEGSSHFTGTISGLAAGDIIDLANTIVTTAVWNGATLYVNGAPTAFSISGGLPPGDTFAFQGDSGGHGTELVVAPQLLTVTSSPVTGVENSGIALGFSEGLTGGATLNSLVISDIPAGATLSDTNGVALTISSGSITLDANEIAAGDLNGLKITTANDTNFTLSAMATALDGSGFYYTVPATENVTVTPAAPTVTWTATATGVENVPVVLGNDLAVAIASQTGDNNSLNTLTISGVPSGAILSDGTNHVTSDGSTPINVKGWTLSSLTVDTSHATIPDGNFQLTATATEKDGDSDISTQATATESVTVTPTAPTLSWAAGTSGTETNISLGTLTDTITGQTGDSNTLNTLTISGVPSGAILSDGTNHVTSDGSTPINVKGWTLSSLTVDTSHAAIPDGNFQLTATATEKDGDSDISTQSTATETVTVTPAAPTVTWTATATGVENTPVVLGNDLAVAIANQTGDSNSLNTLTISGVPSGAILSDGTNHITSDGSTPIDVKGWTLSSLTVDTSHATIPDGNFQLTATATEKDGDGDISTQSTATETVTVTPAAPTVTWTATATGVENTPVVLGNDLAVAIANQTGDSNSLNTLTISGVPSGAILSDGTNHVTSDGSTPINVKGWTLSSLTVDTSHATIPDGNFQLTATATEKDGDGDISTQATATESVTVTPTAPTLSWAAGTSGTETNISLGTLTDTITGQTGDSNTLNTLTISGVPSGAILSDGTNHVTSDGSTPINIKGWTLSSLTVDTSHASIPDGNFQLTATATEKDGDSDISTQATATETVTVTPAAPTVTWTATATGVENAPVVLGNDLAVAIANQTGDNNTLNTLTISGVPSGAILSDGTNHVTSDGSTPINVKGWTLSSLTVDTSHAAIPDGNFQLTATATEKDGDSDISTQSTATETVTVTPAAPTVTWTATATGVENTPVALGNDLAVAIASQTGDNNSLNTLTISGVPSGAILSDGTNHVTSDGSTPINVKGWTLSSLTIDTSHATIPDGNFQLTATATEKDGDGDISTQSTATETVTVTPAAPTVTWTATATGVENTPVVLGNDLAVAIANQTGDSNTLNTLTISGLPSGAILSDGTNHVTSDGSTPINVKGWTLSSLTVDTSHAAIPDGNFQLTATATEKDGDGDISTQATATEAVTVNPTVTLSGLDGDHNAVAGTQVEATVGDAHIGSDITYTWTVGGNTVLNDNGNTYTPTEADDGQALSVSVSYHQTGSGDLKTGTTSAGTVAAAPAVSFHPAYLSFDGNTVATGPVATTQVGNSADDGVTLAGWVDWSGQSNPGNHAQVLFYNGSTSYAGSGVYGIATTNGLDLHVLVGGNQDFDTGIDLSAGQWHDVALTHVNGNFTLYVDGVADFTGQASANGIPNPNDTGPELMQIGGDVGGEDFVGSVANVSVWNAALGQSQIQALQTTSLSGSEANLAAYYPLNDGSGTTVADLVNSAGNLSVSGSPTWVVNGTDTSENTALTLNGLSVSFADAGSDTITTTLEVGHGTLSLGNAAGLISDTGSGTSGSPLILTGTLAAIDAALASGVTYTPTTGYAGTNALSVEAHDGAFQSSTASVAIDVAPVAQAPTLSGPLANVVTDSLTGSTIDSSKWNVVLPTITDTGSNDSSVTPTSSGVVLHDHGYLDTVAGFTPTAATPLHIGLSFTLDSGGGYVAVTDGTDGTIAPLFGAPANGLSFMFDWDGGVEIVNDANGQNTSFDASFSQGTLYDVNITDNGSSQSFVVTNDANSQVVASGTTNFTDYAAGHLVTITNREDNDDMHTATVDNVSISSAYEGTEGGAVTLSGITASVADPSEVLSLVLSGFPAGTTFSEGALANSGTYAGDWVISDPAEIAALGTTPLTVTPPAGYFGTFNLAVEAVATDTATLSTGPVTSTSTATQDFAVTIAPSGNQAPVATASTADYSTVADVSLNLENTGLSVSDTDGGSGIETVTLSVGEGILVATGGNSGVDVVGTGTSTLTVNGTVAEINAFLNDGYVAGTGTPVISDPGFDHGGTGWTFTGTGGITNHDVPHSGTASAYVNSIGGSSGTVSQTVATVAGDYYLVDAWLSYNGSNGTVSISFDNTTGYSATNPNLPSEGHGWQEVSFIAQATGTTGTFQFAGQNVTQTYFIDDVSIVDLGASAPTGSGSSTLSYVDNAASPGASTPLTVTIDDNGNTGGGALSSSASSTIDIAPVNNNLTTVTITVDTTAGIDFQHHNALTEMGSGTVQAGGSATSFTIVDAADNVEFVLDGSNLIYGSDGITLTGGTITSFHEFTADGSTPLADFTGLSVNAITWMSDIQAAANGNSTALDTLTGSFAYNFVGGSGPDTFGSAGQADTLSGTGVDVFDGQGAPAGSHDTLTGGAGSTFVFKAGYGALTITNFDLNSDGNFDASIGDHIELDGFSHPNPSVTDDGNGNATADFGNGDIVTFLHLSAAELNSLGGSEVIGGGGNGNGGPVQIGGPAEPVANDVTIVTNADTGTPISIPVSALLANTSDPDAGDMVFLTGVNGSPFNGSTITASTDFTYQIADRLGDVGSGNVTFANDSGASSISGDGILIMTVPGPVDGGSGNDQLIGSAGDTLSGGAGADTFYYSTGGGAQSIVDFDQGNNPGVFDQSEGDKIDLTGVPGVHDMFELGQIASSANDDGSFNPNGPDTLLNFGNGDTLLLRGISLGNLSDSDFVFSNEVNWSVTSSTGYDGSELYSELGNSVMSSVHDAAHFELTDSTDGLTFEMVGGGLSYSGTTVTGGSITEIDILDSSNNTLVHSTGWNISATALMGAIGDNSALDAIFKTVAYEGSGNSGNDVLVGGNIGNELIGNGGTDTLDGGAGKDLLIASAGGNTTMVGGGGSDLFQYNTATGSSTVATIVDFDQGNGGFNQSEGDTINIASVTSVHNLTGLLSDATTVNDSDTLINFGSGNTLQIDGVSPGQLTAADFQFSPSQPVLNSFTLNVSEGGTTVLTNSDFSVTDPGFTNFTYSMTIPTHGEFEVFNGQNFVSAPTGDFTTAQIAAGQVEFVADGSGVAPTFTIWAGDGSNVSPAISPTVNFIEAPTLSFTTIDVLGASSTVVAGINGSGELVGYETVSGQEFAFEYDGTSFHTMIQDQGATNTVGSAINNLGVISGYYEPNSSTPRYGFTYDSHGDFTQIVSDSASGAGFFGQSTTANGINDAGVLVGSSYLHSVSGVNPVYTGYVDDHGTFTYLNAPGTVTPNGYTAANGINDAGQVVGDFETTYSSNNQGFLYQDGVFTTIDDPNAGTKGTSAQGINDAGQIVGTYYDSSGNEHGFIDNEGVFTTVDNPLGVNGTSLNGINDAGQVVGSYIDANGVTHGFVADETVTLANTSIANAGSLEIDGANSQTITFAGSSGTLVLDDPLGFTGKIAGISGTGDVLDLRGFDAAHDTVVASTRGNYDSGTNTTSLVVTDQTTSNSVTLKLDGDLSGSTWTVTDDGHGGANIVDPPAPGGAAPPIGAAANQVIATAPNQTLTGTGTSNFVFNFPTVGQDIVTNFHPSTDTLQFSSPIFASAQAVLNATQDDGHGNTVITLDAHDAIVLSGVLKAQLQAADFHFV